MFPVEMQTPAAHLPPAEGTVCPCVQAPEVRSVQDQMTYWSPGLLLQVSWNPSAVSART